MADGWRCPVCGRGVHPDEEVCDHHDPRVSFEVRPRYVAPVDDLKPDCGCPPFTVCGSTACPRLPKVTCGGAGAEGVPAGTDGLMRWS